MVTWANVAMGVAARLGNMYCLGEPVTDRAGPFCLRASSGCVSSPAPRLGPLTELALNAETSVGSRVSVVVLVFSASYVMLAASVHWSLGFGAAIFAIVCAGGSSALGESVMLGYLKRYPAGLVGGWSSGTGISHLSPVHLSLCSLLATRSTACVTVQVTRAGV